MKQYDKDSKIQCPFCWKECSVASIGTETLSFDSENAGTPIRVFLTGIKNPIYSSIRSSGIAYIGTRWSGFEVERIQIEQEIPT
jgi:hypothetical protein